MQEGTSNYGLGNKDEKEKQHQMTGTSAHDNHSSIYNLAI